VNIVQITPGAGGMYCGNCFRDNALVAALRQIGHSALLVPLYLPMTLEEEDQSAGTPIFFGGINVYLQQKSGLFRNAPGWLHRLLNSRRLLEWAAGRAASTKASEVGELLLSMLRGEHGHQNREITELITWLREHAKPDVICLSNALLIGMTRRLKADQMEPGTVTCWYMPRWARCFGGRAIIATGDSLRTKMESLTLGLTTPQRRCSMQTVVAFSGDGSLKLAWKTSIVRRAGRD